MNANRKFVPGRQYELENCGCYVDGPCPVHRLRHREGDPLFIAIVRDTLCEMGLGGSLEATDDDICVGKNMKISAGID